MTGETSTISTAEPFPAGGRAKPGTHFWQNAIAACVSLAWNATVLILSLELPEGHSRGDLGPGALPMQIAVLGLLASAIYLIQVLRGMDFGGADGKIDVPRVAGLIGLFIAASVSSAWVGLAVSLGLATGLATLLFTGEKLLLRAVLTGVGFWAIAYVIFGMLLDLPLP